MGVDDDQGYDAKLPDHSDSGGKTTAAFFKLQEKERVRANKNSNITIVIDQEIHFCVTRLFQKGNK